MWQYYDSSSALKLISLWFSIWSTSQSALWVCYRAPYIQESIAQVIVPKNPLIILMGNIYHTVKCLLFQFLKKCCQLCSFLIHNTLCIPSNDLFSHSCLPHQSQQVTYQAPNQHRLSLTNNSISYFQLVVYFLFLLLLPLYMFFNSTVKKMKFMDNFLFKKLTKH